MIIDKEMLKLTVANNITYPVDWVFLDEVDSTNQYLIDYTQKNDVLTPTVCVARRQLRGRGQRERLWFGEDDKQLTFSLLWPWQTNNLNLPSCLSLQSALNVAQSISPLLSREKVLVKWPNDLLLGEKKLAGILLESSSQGRGKLNLIIGLGFNLYPFSDSTLSMIDKKVAFWSDYVTPGFCSTTLSATIISSVIKACFESQNSMVTNFVTQWSHHDALFGKNVRLAIAGGEIVGNCIGINSKGALLLKTGKTIKEIISASVVDYGF